MRKIVLSVIVFLSSLNLYAQQIVSIDIVRIDQRYEREAMHYYEQNWKAFREAALGDGHISGFNLLRTMTDSTQHFNLVLITEFPDSASFNNREANFRPIMKRISPGGPKLLNRVPPKQFLEYVNGVDAVSVVRGP